MIEKAQNPVLLLIDLQQAIDHPDWGVRNNPGAEQNIAKLLGFWRARGWKIVHVRHDSVEPNSHYQPGRPTHAFKPEAVPASGEDIVSKTVNSAFIGTGLEALLKAAACDLLVVAGVITNNSIEASVRHAGNLGFNTVLAEDACFTFARKDWNGVMRSAEDVHAMSLANLDKEYCTVMCCEDLF